MKQLFVSLSFYFIITITSGQTASTPIGSFSVAWHPGTVVFEIGDTLNCEVRFNAAIPVGVLQIRSDGLVLTIAPEDVKSFTWFDPRKQRMRKYYSVTVTTEEFSTHRAYMECLYNGAEFSILNHRTLGLAYEYQHYTRFVSKPSHVNRQYLLDFSSGELLPLSRENALRIVENKAEVMSFIEEQGIRFRSVQDYIHVFEYYASL